LSPQSSDEDFQDYAEIEHRWDAWRLRNWAKMDEAGRIGGINKEPPKDLQSAEAIESTPDQNQARAAYPVVRLPKRLGSRLDHNKCHRQEWRFHKQGDSGDFAK
jgi:hypothetical protein